MKTSNPQLWAIRGIFKAQKRRGTPILWICGKKMWRKLTSMHSNKVIHFSFMGTRTIYNIPVKIGHPNLKDDEIILFTEKEMRFIKNGKSKPNHRQN